jgi:mannonate dehydratase
LQEKTKVLEGWRWFGPDAGVSLDDVRQAGASQVVSALHDVPIGQAWTEQQVRARKQMIEAAAPGRTPLTWSVVESIPVPDAVKRTGAAARDAIDAWIASLEAVAACGIRIVCYNFMPVVDWTRTEIDHPLPTGATAMRFDHDRFAAFDLHILRRPGAEADHDEAQRRRARSVYEAMSDAERAAIVTNITSALPGSTTEPLTVEAFRARLTQYAHVDAPRLRRHLIEFLDAVTPVAERLGVVLTLHPDDPPRPLFGLPRVASTEADYAALFEAVPSAANGMCFCTGSLGVRPDNDLPAMARRFADRIHFAHLRATRREADGLSFYEADHLGGDVDMVQVLVALLAEDARRDRSREIVYRSDHGHRMLDDLAKRVNPGYPAIGRLKGLAELRGVVHAIQSLRPTGGGVATA